MVAGLFLIWFSCLHRLRGNEKSMERANISVTKMIKTGQRCWTLDIPLPYPLSHYSLIGARWHHGIDYRNPNSNLVLMLPHKNKPSWWMVQTTNLSSVDKSEKKCAESQHSCPWVIELRLWAVPQETPIWTEGGCVEHLRKTNKTYHHLYHETFIH